MTAAYASAEALVVASTALPQSSPATAAGPGGEGAPFGSGRGQHAWTDWLSIDGPGVEEELSERVCRSCGTTQIAPTDSLVSVTALRPRRTTIRREAA